MSKSKNQKKNAGLSTGALQALAVIAGVLVAGGASAAGVAVYDRQRRMHNGVKLPGPIIGKEPTTGQPIIRHDGMPAVGRWGQPAGGWQRVGLPYGDDAWMLVAGTRGDEPPANGTGTLPNRTRGSIQQSPRRTNKDGTPIDDGSGGSGGGNGGGGGSKVGNTLGRIGRWALAMWTGGGSEVALQGLQALKKDDSPSNTTGQPDDGTSDAQQDAENGAEAVEAAEEVNQAAETGQVPNR